MMTLPGLTPFPGVLLLLLLLLLLRLLLSGAKGQLPIDKIWQRLAALHLLALKMWQHGDRPPGAFRCGLRHDVTLYSSLTGKKGGWGPAHDFALVRGVFMLG
jgi:hypothetical protein